MAALHMIEPHADAVGFSWQRNDEIDEGQGDGRAELQPDGSLSGAVRFQPSGGCADHTPFDLGEAILLPAG